MGEPSELAHGWLRLAMTPGVGPVLGRRLAQAAGGVAAIWRHLDDPGFWSGVRGVGPALLHALRKQNARAVREEIAACRAHGIMLLHPDHPAYPPALQGLVDAPLVLFAQGCVRCLAHARMLAVVGARKASREGRLLAERWGGYFARHGVVVVSGLAWGIDQAAHEGAYKAQAPSVAVLGHGLLAEGGYGAWIKRIADTGCVVSEFLPHTAARREYFPRRNRIIAGLARGTLVIEAGMRSGALITARHAVNYGREVMAVPGSVLSDRHAGCHALIRQGALLVETAEQCLQALGWQDEAPATEAATVSLDGEQQRIVDALRHGPCSLDQLAETCGLTIPQLSPILLALELRGVVERLPGGRYLLNLELRDQ
ncbi:MAG: DNA-protecting protein DprA [Zetaproteobacteria bacterium]|nr:MAG: DNA-protecting protein DprA [Zetaproteobacteria bacterium]